MRYPSVSKLHAHFRVGEGGKLDLIDLESANGTRVNGRALAANNPEWVGPGDTILVRRGQRQAGRLRTPSSNCSRNSFFTENAETEQNFSWGGSCRNSILGFF